MAQPDFENDFDDELGYYADGVKRTLTDDQIAMFRHSETQALLRDRRLAQESADTYDTVSAHEGRTVEGVNHKEVPNDQPSPAELLSEQTKRKWEHFIDISEENPENLTHRRMARELDELRPDSVDLMYGEDDNAQTLQQQQKKLDQIRTSTFQWPSLGVEQTTSDKV